MFYVFEKYLGYSNNLSAFHNREAAEQFISRVSLIHSMRRYVIEFRG